MRKEITVILEKDQSGTITLKKIKKGQGQDEDEEVLLGKVYDFTPRSPDELSESFVDVVVVNKASWRIPL